MILIGITKFIFGLKGKILGNLRNLNYETKNEEIYDDTTSEILVH